MKSMHFNNCWKINKIRWDKIANKKVKCPYCDKLGSTGLMHRYHFKNCKFNNL